jgi:phage-related protein
MAYETFPVLTRRISYGISENFVDHTIRTELGLGSYESSRAGAVREIKEFDAKYSFLGDKDMDLLKAFELKIKIGSQAFYWINPKEVYGKLLWEANETLIEGQIRRPTVNNGHSYVASTAGTTATTEPVTWATGTNATFTNGTVLFQENTYLVRFMKSGVRGRYIFYGENEASFKLREK